MTSVDQLHRLVDIMDRLRSPGGCPWDAEQTHRSLAEYLLEETYETLEAIEHGSRNDLIEELGDLLLQVVFHARLGEESADPWSIEDVAAAISEKLIRRHPHVFEDPAEGRSGSGEPDRPSPGSREGWAQAKAREKARTSALDGIPRTLPALSQAQKTWRRAHELGVWDRDEDVPREAADRAITEPELRTRLMSLVVAAEGSGLDAEGVLRAGIEDLRARIRDLEATA